MQWHQLDHTQTIRTSLQTDNHTNTSSLIFLQARCSSRRPTNSVKALKAQDWTCSYEDMIADRQTHSVSHTHRETHITILCSPTGGRVIICILCCRQVNLDTTASLTEEAADSDGAVCGLVCIVGAPLSMRVNDRRLRGRSNVLTQF